MAKQRRALSRPPLERIHRIHQLLVQGARPNCSSLAREFETSTRTIMRDLDFMRDRLNLPIEWDGAHNGFIYTRPVSHFPHLSVSEAETFALLVAHKAIAQYQGTPFQQPLETAFRRLTGQLDQDSRFSLGNLDQVLSFRPFAPEDADLRAFETLTRAVREHQVLQFLYRNRGARIPEKRRVHPYHLACIDNLWYLLAFDAHRRALRTFALSRIQQLTATPEHFERPPDFHPDQYLSGSFNVFKGHEDYEVVVDFDSWAADEIRGRKWHASQQLEDLPQGALRLRMRLNNIEEVERWLLSFGTHATVLGPKVLLDRLHQIGLAFTQRYPSGSQG